VGTLAEKYCISYNDWRHVPAVEGNLARLSRSRKIFLPGAAIRWWERFQRMPTDSRVGLRTLHGRWR
jgi:hypothetical protein